MTKCTCNCGAQIDSKQTECACGAKFLPCACPNIMYNMEKIFARKRHKHDCGERLRKAHTFCIENYHEDDDLNKNYKISVRLEQMAIRPVRYLTCTRNEHLGVMSRNKKRNLRKNINREIMKSQSTLYTILTKKTNLPDDTIIKKPKKWSKSDWSKYDKWVADRAKPKKLFKPKSEENHTVPLEKLSRYQKLSNPRLPRTKFQPKESFYGMIRPVPQTALTYEASPLIHKLSQPRYRRIKIT